MQIKALLLDFDRTLVSRDILTELTALVGRKDEAEKHHNDFQSQSGKAPKLGGLIARINMLTGVPISKVVGEVQKDLTLVDGARELVSYCAEQEIVTILATGTIHPVAEVYQQELGIDYVVCSHPRIKDGVITGISEDDYPKGDEHFKVAGTTEILNKIGITKNQCAAVGDGRGDIPMFEFAEYCYAINPKGGIEAYADEVVVDLHQVVQSLQKLSET